MIYFCTGSADYLNREVVIIGASDGNVVRYIPRHVKDDEPIYLVHSGNGRDSHFQVRDLPSP